MDLIRKNMTGVAVGRVQQVLIEAGYEISAIELGATLFGDSTYAAVRAFQASHLGSDGHPLGEDGVVGAETWYALTHPGQAGVRYTVPGWRCEPSQIREAVRRVVEIAAGEIGVHEDPDGSNDGRRIRAYTAPDFIGSPWCALFASWAFQQGAEEGSPFGRVASTWGLYEWAQARGRVLGEAALPQAGDVFVILRGERRGHTGIVCGVTDDGRLCTIEGNASNAVRGCLRGRSAVSAVLRPVPLV